MPTYQYRCTACERDFEFVQKFTDPTLTDCPECEGGLRKVFNAVGVVFKGSGFYATDSRKSKSASTSAAASSSSESKSESKPKPDSKAAAKKPAASSKTAAAS